MASLPQPASTSTTGPRLVTLKEAAERLTLSPRALRTLIAQGSLPAVQLSARRKGVVESDLQAWIETRRMPRTRTGAIRGGS